VHDTDAGVVMREAHLVGTAALDRQRFANMFGIPADQLPRFVTDKIESSDFRYRMLSRSERDAVILRIIKHLKDRPTSVMDDSRRALWAKVWEEQRAKAREGGFDESALEPSFVSGERVVRLDGNFVMPRSPRMELDFYAVIRRMLFHRWIDGATTAMEFGCGSAFNIADLAEMYPQLAICGLDWAPASVNLVEDLARSRGFNMKGRLFDFFEPDETLQVPRDAAIFTFCALEQTGEKHKMFIEFLLRKRPKICVHMEPILELYHPESLVDSLAISFHRARRYLGGFLPRLRELKDSGAIHILDERRLGFGSLFHESFSVVVWRPV